MEQNGAHGVKTGRIATLDVIRGILMVMIVCTHMVFQRVQAPEAR